MPDSGIWEIFACRIRNPGLWSSEFSSIRCLKGVPFQSKKWYTAKSKKVALVIGHIKQCNALLE